MQAPSGRRAKAEKRVINDPQLRVMKGVIDVSRADATGWIYRPEVLLRREPEPLWLETAKRSGDSGICAGRARAAYATFGAEGVLRLSVCDGARCQVVCCTDGCLQPHRGLANDPRRSSVSSRPVRKKGGDCRAFRRALLDRRSRRAPVRRRRNPAAEHVIPRRVDLPL